MLPLSPWKLPVLLAVCGVLSVFGSVLSAVPDKIQAPKLTITSRTMTAQGKEQKAFFEGAVVLTQGDLIIHSDHMVVIFKRQKDEQKQESEEKGFGQQIERVVATGRVVIEKSSGKATCGRAVYIKDEEKVVLTETPVACQNGTEVTGSRMTMFLKEDRSIVEGGSRVIIPEDGNDQCKK